MRHLMRRSSPRGLIAIASVLAVAAAAVVPGLSSANVNVSKSGWAWANPTPQGRTLLNIAFSGGVGYAVGLGGTALSTSDGGQSWTGLTTGTSADLERVQVLEPDDRRGRRWRRVCDADLRKRRSAVQAHLQRGRIGLC